MNKYTDAGLVTDEPMIACMFFDKEIIPMPKDDPVGYYPTVKVKYISTEYFDVYQLCIPWKLVAEAIKPVEGEACFHWDSSSYTTSLLSKHYPMQYEVYGIDIERRICVKANPITTGKTVGELRELLKYTGGAM